VSTNIDSSCYFVRNSQLSGHSSSARDADDYRVFLKRSSKTCLTYYFSRNKFIKDPKSSNTFINFPLITTRSLLRGAALTALQLADLSLKKTYLVY
jgi:hypothetical protein